MPRGAKGKLTKELIEKAADIIARGNYYKVAIDILGISEQSWYEWMRQGEMDKSKGIKSLKSEFFESIKKAEADAIDRNLSIIQKAAMEGNWQASAWYLERKYPEQWGKRDNVNLTTDKDGFRIEVEYVSGRGNDNGRENKEQG
jgi:hypothetical protein